MNICTHKSGLALLVVLTMVAVGCATTSGSKVSYGDATAVETTTIGFGSTDLQQIAQKLVDDMLAFPPVVEMTAGRRPVIVVDKVKNKTMEHIDTESITDTIKTKLLNSGKFRFAERQNIEVAFTEREFQQAAGVDPATAARENKMVGAEFFLDANFSSIEKRDNRSRDLYYKFSLKLTNVETGITEWMGEKEIRKTSTRSTFGR